MSHCKKIAVLLIVALAPIAALASTDSQLEAAAERGAVAFVLVTDRGAGEIESSRQTIRGAMAEVSGSILIECDRSATENAAFVQRYRLAVAPAPLILVFASNGALVGGNTAARLTTQQLVAMIPSPKKAEVLQALQAGKSVYVTASRSGMAAKSDVVKGCAAACTQLQGRSVSVDVSMDDPAEKGLLSELKVDLQAIDPVTVVINSQGQITGSYLGAVPVESLIASATKVVSSGCCPSGSGKTCDPAPAKENK